VSIHPCSPANPISCADPEPKLPRALGYLDAQLRPKDGIPGRRVFIGEYGFPADRYAPQDQDALSRRVMRIGLGWGCPFVLYWQIYNNALTDGRQRGFSLIDDDARKQPVYFTLPQYYGNAGLGERLSTPAAAPSDFAGVRPNCGGVAPIIGVPARSERLRFASCLHVAVEPLRNRPFGRGFLVNFRAGSNRNCPENSQSRVVGERALTSGGLRKITGTSGLLHNRPVCAYIPATDQNGGMALASRRTAPAE